MVFPPARPGREFWICWGTPPATPARGETPLDSPYCSRSSPSCFCSSFLWAATDDDHGGTEDAVAEHVALLHLGDDLALLALAVHDGLVVARVEVLALGLDLSDAARLQDRLELAVDEADAVDPGEAGEVGVDAA